MAEFKPMVKMMTTEPSVVLKLKKGGTVQKAAGGRMAKVVGNAVRKATSAAPTSGMPSRVASAVGKAVSRAPMIRPAGMKEGGETPKMHAKEMTKLSNLEKEMKSHEGKKASVAHKGLKTGGVVNGQGGYKTGGVVKGQGGYKEGGAAKKHYATGGVVDSGAPVAMPKKPASKPVRINELAGTFRNGGGVSKKC